MRKGLEDKLFTKFPKLYRGKDLSIQENLMSFGFECHSGWYDIIHNLSEAITTLDPDGEIIAMQVKEKFGGLRFYIDAGSDEIYAAIHKAEHCSLETCESCGESGMMNTEGYWLSVRCDKCREIEQEEKKNE